MTMIIIPMIVSFVNITLYSHWTILVCPCLHCRNPVFFSRVRWRFNTYTENLFILFFGIGLHWQEFFYFDWLPFFYFLPIFFHPLFFYCISLPLVLSILKFCISYSSFLLFFLLPTHILSPSSPKRVFSFQAAKGVYHLRKEILNEV